MSFVNPVLLWGAGLISIPIVIHLINRQRYKIVDWAAMEFLLEAYRERKRRVLLEQLLLLLLRCLAILLLAFVLARPFLSEKILGGALGQSGVTRLLVLDDSASMRADAGGQPAFDRARDAAIALAGKLAETHPGDRVVVVRASAPERSFAIAEPIGQKAVELKGKLAALVCSYRQVALGDALERFTAAFLSDEDKAAGRAVYLATDLRLRDWTGASSASRAISAVIQRGPFVLLDAGAGTAENLVVTSVKTDPPIPLAGLPFDLVVVVANKGSQTRRDVPVEARVGGTRLSERTIAEIEPGGTGTVSIPAPAIDEPGWTSVELALPADSLAADDVHHAAIDLKAGLGVLIVDVDGSAPAEERESYFLEKALAPRGAHRSGIAPEITSPAQFQQNWDLAAYDVVALANCVPDPKRIEILERFVAQGGSVLWIVGDRVPPAEINRVAFKDGKGLLPLALGEAQDLSPAGGQASDPVHFLPQTDGEPLKVFSGQGNPLRRAVHVYRAVRTLAADPASSTEVLARYTDAEGQVAMATKPFGAGRTFLITTACDLAWGDWPKDPSYLVFAHQLVGYLTAHKGELATSRPGAQLRLPLDPARFGTRASYKAPEAKDKLEVVADRGTDADTLELAIEVGESPGIGQLELAPVTGNAKATRRFAVNVDPVEGELRRIETAALKQQLPDTGYALVDLARGSDELAGTLAGEKQEIWLVLALALLAVLFLESTLAFVFGRKR